MSKPLKELCAAYKNDQITLEELVASLDRSEVVWSDPEYCEKMEKWRKNNPCRLYGTPCFFCDPHQVEGPNETNFNHCRFGKINASYYATCMLKDYSTMSKEEIKELVLNKLTTGKIAFTGVPAYDHSGEPELFCKRASNKTAQIIPFCPPEKNCKYCLSHPDYVMTPELEAAFLDAFKRQFTHSPVETSNNPWQVELVLRKKWEPSDLS